MVINAKTRFVFHETHINTLGGSACSVLLSIISSAICPFLLHCVHEVAFDTAENDDGEGEGDKHEEGAVEEASPVEGAATQATVFESFEDGSEGVELENGFIFLWGCAQRVDDRSGIHEELDAESDKELQVTVLGSQG